MCIFYSQDNKSVRSCPSLKLKSTNTFKKTQKTQSPWFQISIHSICLMMSRSTMDPVESTLLNSLNEQRCGMVTRDTSFTQTNSLIRPVTVKQGLHFDGNSVSFECSVYSECKPHTTHSLVPRPFVMDMCLVIIINVIINQFIHPLMFSWCNILSSEPHLTNNFGKLLHVSMGRLV